MGSPKILYLTGDNLNKEKIVNNRGGQYQTDGVGSPINNDDIE